MYFIYTHLLYLQNLHYFILKVLKNSYECHLVLACLASYLEQQLGQVTLRGSTSASCSPFTGVPHGSLLGPLMFFLYSFSISEVIWVFIPLLNLFSPFLPRHSHFCTYSWLDLSLRMNLGETKS